MATAPRPENSSSLSINLNLGNVPKVDDYRLYEALLEIYNALETLATYVGDTDSSITTVVNNIYETGAVQLNTTVVAVPAYTIQSTDGVILARPSAENITITLESANTVGSGISKTIKHTTSVHEVHVVPATGDNLDGDSSTFILYPEESITVNSDGNDWYII